MTGFDFSAAAALFSYPDNRPPMCCLRFECAADAIRHVIEQLSAELLRIFIRHPQILRSPDGQKSGQRGGCDRAEIPARTLDLKNADGFHQRNLPAHSMRLAQLWVGGGLASGPDRILRAGRDAYLHVHAKIVRRDSDERAVERDRVTGIAHDRDGH